jgi:hypothetical protein
MTKPDKVAGGLLKIRIEAMPRTFKPWNPATAELELLHECWLARLPPAMIAARLCISEPKLNRFMRRLKTARDMPRPEPARPRQRRPQAPSSAADRLIARACSANEQGGRRALVQDCGVRR